jgi:enamine deaminase RidA (YjgF/YER057c/UK114 family)
MRQYLEGTEMQKQRAFSPAVITQGGRMVWLAGHTTTQDDEGRDIAYHFEAQVRQVFKNLDNTLRRAGGSLADMVTMTVFILDVRLGTRFTEIRREIFPDGKYPASALITVAGFARPGIVIEIQGIAVLDADTP